MKRYKFRSATSLRHDLLQALVFFVCLWGVGHLYGCPSQVIKKKKEKVVAPVPPVAVKKQERLPSFFSGLYQLPSRAPFRPSRGPKHVLLQVVEWVNPLSETSRTVHSLRKEVWERFPGMVRWTIRMSPRLGKDRGYFYARAFLAAQKLGIFWPFLRLFFKKKGDKSFRQLLQMAKMCGVDPQLFELRLLYEPYKMIVDQDMRLAQHLGVGGRSGLFVNGALLRPPYTKQRLFAALVYAKRKAEKALEAGATFENLHASLTKKGRRLSFSKQVPRAIAPRRYLHIPFGFLESIPTRGQGDSPVHIVEFSDFTCRPCRKAYFYLDHLLKLYPKQIRFSFKYYPIGIHKESFRSAELAAAAQDRRKFWKMYHLLFQKQKAVFQGRLLELAKLAGLDADWIAGELDRRSYLRRVRINHMHGRRLGIRAVPTLLINGLKVSGIRSEKQLLRTVRIELWKAGSPQVYYP